MTGRVYFILIMTFITGMFAGAYLYITSFAVNDSNENIPEISFQITGIAGGDCMENNNVCASFTLDQNRKFVYIPQHSIHNNTPENITGRIHKNIFNELTEIIQDTNLAQLQEQSGECAYARNPDSYVYNIIVDGTSQTLNTCVPLFKSSELSVQLQSLWVIFNKPATVTENGGGISNFLMNHLKENFQN